MKKFLCVVAVFFGIVNTYGQEMPTIEVIERAIAFHDPTDQWYKSDVTLIIETKMPIGSDRTSWIELHNSTGDFCLKTLKDNELLEWHMPAAGTATFKHNFLDVADSLEQVQWQLTEEKAIWWQDYYSYLYGLPMNLKDEGTRLGETARMTQFEGQRVWAVRVTYSPEVGDDIWYFYFDTKTFALVGYRFYHDEAANDGEYIVLANMEIKGNLRIPKKRTWYSHQENKLLGEDVLVTMQIRRK